ncbi:MAG: exported protein of unknown function [Blastococcus sp.]|nr:exported protein of unknown function [Blastococcus sp.]
MTGIRRSLLLLALTVAVVFGGLGPAHPAQASFSETMTAATTQIATATVAPPTNVTGSLTCTKTAATMAATWNLSTSTRISGYLVSVTFSDGFVQTVQLGATATSWSAPISLYNATTYSIQYSVTTQTTYGWTMESARTGWFTC